MSKELEVIKRDLDYEKCVEIVKKEPNCCLAPRVNAIDTIEQKLKDFEWLKSKINIDFFYQLPTEDRVKLAEILGIKL